MKLPKPVLQLGAIVSSAVLIGAFVCYRAGAFNGLTETNMPLVDAGSSPTIESNEPDSPKEEKVAVDPAAARVDPSFLAGSKSLSPLIVPPSQTSSAQQPPPPTTPLSQAIMYSSKSAPIFIPPQGSIVPPPATATKPAPRTP